MTEPTDRDREMAKHRLERRLFAMGVPIESAPIREALDAVYTLSRPNLPPLFDPDDWLWVAQSLGYVQFARGDFDGRDRMDRIIAKILEYRAEDVRREPGK